MIDTPGHVDFTYEVSRSLAACEGTVLLVDAAQGIEAQTLANLYLAMENDLTIIPVLNKIDLPAAQPEKFAAELAHIIGCDPDDVLRVSAKTGVGVPRAAGQGRREVPAPGRRRGRAGPRDDLRLGLRRLPRRRDLRPGRRRHAPHARAHPDDVDRRSHELLEIGVISPEPMPSDGLGVGEVGYLITGVKDVRQSKVGDTITNASQGRRRRRSAATRTPSRWCSPGLYPLDGSDYPELRDALDKLQLNDAALVYEPETSAALGFGFRCGFLGLLHLEIIRERLEREFGLDLIATAPNVVYRVVHGGRRPSTSSPTRASSPTGKIAEVHEPVVRATILAPSEYIGAIMELCQTRRGTLLGMDYLSEDRVEIRYTLPLAEIVFDFFDQLKSRTRGYASLDYEPTGEQAADLVKVDILLQGEKVDAFSAIVHKDKAYAYGVRMSPSCAS